MNKLVSEKIKKYISLKTTTIFFKSQTQLPIFLFLLIIITFISYEIVYGQQVSNTISNAESLGITLRDKSLSIEEFVSGLDWPTTMTFVDNDILVLEKDTGNVRLIRDGELQDEPVLKINVSHMSDEEGLLGILAKNSSVYLHFTTRSSDANIKSNWFYKYTWDGKNLTQPILLKEIRGGPGIHNSGPMVLHPDGTVYAILGDLGERKGVLQNYPVGIPDDTSVIFSLDNSSSYYAIGIRNSFGLTVDHVTGYIWDTENGPESFDEINLVLPKFNSGWASIQGPASQTQIENLPSFDGYAYSDPEFSWERPVAVTAISFIKSKLFKEYNNSVLVGDFNNGILYEFKLNKNRTGFIFNNHDLFDLVLNKDDVQTQEIILGVGFSGITDIKEGPDGMIYVVSIGDGKIYRIFPSKDTSRSADLIRCLETPKPSIDLSGCNLSGLNLQNIDLSYADLSFSNLENTNLTNINLHGVTLSGSNLLRTSLNDVDLSNADISSVIFKDANLENINFENANMRSTNLRNTTFSNVDLTNTDLGSADFGYANLSYSILNNANLGHANFANAVLQNIEMKNTNLFRVSFKHSVLNNVDLRNTTVWKTDFTDAHLQTVNFVEADIFGSQFIKTNLQNTDFSNSKIGNSIFSHSDLSGTIFLDVYPFETLFDNVVITKETKINTCLEHDLFSRLINKILRDIRGGNLDFLNFIEIPIVQLCKIS